MIVVDTNVASELMRPSPAVAVRDWVRGQDARGLCTTAITVAEIRYRIERLPDGRRKDGVRAAAAEIFGMFAEQVLPFDAAAAEPRIADARRLNTAPGLTTDHRCYLRSQHTLQVVECQGTVGGTAT
jgi:predicted nucleic acid-binding protein